MLRVIKEDINIEVGERGDEKERSNYKIRMYNAYFNVFDEDRKEIKLNEEARDIIYDFFKFYFKEQSFKDILKKISSYNDKVFDIVIGIKGNKIYPEREDVEMQRNSISVKIFDEEGDLILDKNFNGEKNYNILQYRKLYDFLIKYDKERKNKEYKFTKIRYK